MKRPYVHVNCASTVDGKIALVDGRRLRISDRWDMERVHLLRRRLGSVLVGAGTVISDDPKLSARSTSSVGRIPVTKIVVDGRGRISPGSRFLKTEGRSLVVTSDWSENDWRDSIRREGGEIVMIDPESENGNISIPRLLNVLKSMDVHGILVEGGSRIIWEFVSSGLFDRFTVYFGPLFLGGSGPTISSGPGFDKKPMELKLTSQVRSPEGGILLEYSPIS